MWFDSNVLSKCVIQNKLRSLFTRCAADQQMQSEWRRRIKDYHAYEQFQIHWKKAKGKTFKQVFEEDKEYVLWVQAHESELSFAYRIFNMYAQLRHVKQWDWFNAKVSLHIHDTFPGCNHWISDRECSLRPCPVIAGMCLLLWWHLHIPCLAQIHRVCALG